METKYIEKFIEDQGGASKLAQKLSLPKKSGVQTVSNWKRRGIPKAVMFDHPRIFAPLVRKLREKV